MEYRVLYVPNAFSDIVRDLNPAILIGQVSLKVFRRIAEERLFPQKLTDELVSS